MPSQSGATIVHMEIVDLPTVSKFIGVMAPDWAWLLQRIESEDGYVKFPPQFSLFIRNLNIDNYPELYENEAAIGAMMLRAFMEPEQIKELESKLVSLSSEERGKFLEEVIGDFKDVGDGIAVPETLGERKRALRMFYALSPTEKQQSIMFLRRFMMAFLASFYQSVSVMQ